MSLAESYVDRSVFVTGHTGFKGAWLAEWLTTLGAEVTGYALDRRHSPACSKRSTWGSTCGTWSRTSGTTIAWRSRCRRRGLR